MIIGIMKVWNEADILEDTLNHLSEHVDHMIIYDDASTDGTTDILMERALTSNNLLVALGEERHINRPAAQGGTLQILLEQAVLFEPEWILQLDADERLVWPDIDLREWDGVRMKLYDYYITPEDVDSSYLEREWIGPEFRNILMMYRPFPGMAYGWHDQREMWGLPRTWRIANAGYVKHYSKAISVERWERQCDYYADFFPEPYASKWAARRGKAIHHDMMSDFDRPLIKWEDRDAKGVVI